MFNKKHKKHSNEVNAVRVKVRNKGRVSDENLEWLCRAIEYAMIDERDETQVATRKFLMWAFSETSISHIVLDDYITHLRYITSVGFTTSEKLRELSKLQHEAIAFDKRAGAMVISNYMELVDTLKDTRTVIVEHFLRTQESLLLSATAGSGKTIITTNLCLAAASGVSFGSFKVPEQGVKVMLLDGEMYAPQHIERARSFIHGMGYDTKKLGDNMSVYFRTMQKTGHKLDLANKADRAAVIEECVDKGIKLLVVDNLSTLLTVENENSASDYQELNNFIVECRQIDTAVIIIDHVGKIEQDKNGMVRSRGSSAKETAVDLTVGLLKERSKELKPVGVQNPDEWTMTVCTRWTPDKVRDTITEVTSVKYIAAFKRWNEYEHRSESILQEFEIEEAQMVTQEHKADRKHEWAMNAVFKGDVQDREELANCYGKSYTSFDKGLKKELRTWLIKKGVAIDVQDLQRHKQGLQLKGNIGWDTILIELIKESKCKDMTQLAMMTQIPSVTF